MSDEVMTVGDAVARLGGLAGLYERLAVQAPTKVSRSDVLDARAIRIVLDALTKAGEENNNLNGAHE